MVDAQDNAASLYGFADVFELSTLKSAVLTAILKSEDIYASFCNSEVPHISQAQPDGP